MWKANDLFLFIMNYFLGYHKRSTMTTRVLSQVTLTQENKATSKGTTVTII